MKLRKKIAVIGCGFYGLYTAIYLAKLGYEVSVYERNSKGMQEASLLNQARVHGGYHYPRSLSTGARSRTSCNRFLEDFSEAIKPEVKSYYAIANGSKVSAHKFEQFCKMIGAPLFDIPNFEKELFNNGLIEKVFEAPESYFDSQIILNMLMTRATKLSVKFEFNQEVNNVQISDSTLFSLETDETIFNGYDKVIVATYGKMQHGFAKESKKISYEVCELIQIRSPDSLNFKAITVMDGPYWSLTPWPSFSCSVLTHVRFTPHGRFENPENAQQFIKSGNLKSRADVIKADVARYFPLIADYQVIGSKFVVKTILNSKEKDDARPIIAHVNDGICYLIGGKMDNIYDSESYVLDYVSN